MKSTKFLNLGIVFIIVFPSWITAQQNTTIYLRPVDSANISGTVPDSDFNAESVIEPRILLRFDLSEIPYAKRVIYSELTIGEIPLPDDFQNFGLILSPIQKPWNGDDVDWDQCGFDSDWNQPGGDWDDLEIAYSAVGSGLRRPPFFNVTSVVRDWVSGASEKPNYGFLLMVTEDTPNTDALIQILDVRRLDPLLKVEFAE